MPEQELLPPLEPSPGQLRVACYLIFLVRLELAVREVPDTQLLPVSSPDRQEPSPKSLWLQPPEKENEMSRTLTLSAMVVAAAFATALPAAAEDEYNVSTGITTAGAPLGLHGVDAVALTTLNAVAEGNAQYTVVDDGVAYYFASEESAKKFKANPAMYAPQYGGFCAYAVALGKKFDGDPQYADIVDGKLYLFVNAEIFEKYKKDSKRILGKAERTWPRIEHKAVGDL
jgi:YHS domain-containing protein